MIAYGNLRYRSFRIILHSHHRFDRARTKGHGESRTYNRAIYAQSCHFSNMASCKPDFQRASPATKPPYARSGDRRKYETDQEYHAIHRTSRFGFRFRTLAKRYLILDNTTCCKLGEYSFVTTNRCRGTFHNPRINH